MALFYKPPNSSVILDISGLIVLKGAKRIDFNRGTLKVHHVLYDSEQECSDGWRSFELFLLKNQGAIE